MNKNAYCLQADIYMLSGLAQKADPLRLSIKIYNMNEIKNENLKIKNDKEKFKKEFKLRIYNWSLDLVKLIDALSKDSVSKVISNQLIRSGTSVGANYVEAQAASSKKDFIKFIHYCLKSANECKFWLCLLKDTNRSGEKQIERLLNEIVEISNIFGSSLLTLKGKRN